MEEAGYVVLFPELTGKFSARSYDREHLHTFDKDLAVSFARIFLRPQLSQLLRVLILQGLSVRGLDDTKGDAPCLKVFEQFARQDYC